MSESTLRALCWLLLLTALMWLWRAERRETRRRIADDRIFAAVEQARTDIDGINDDLPEWVAYRHPCGLLLIVRRPVDLTDLQRAETPADIWRNA